MKNVFGMKVTKGEQTASFDGAVFMAQRLDEEQQGAVDEVSEETLEELAFSSLDEDKTLLLPVGFSVVSSYVSKKAAETQAVKIAKQQIIIIKNLYFVKNSFIYPPL